MTPSEGARLTTRAVQANSCLLKSSTSIPHYLDRPILSERIKPSRPHASFKLPGATTSSDANVSGGCRRKSCAMALKELLKVPTAKRARVSNVTSAHARSTTVAPIPRAGWVLKLWIVQFVAEGQRRSLAIAFRSSVATKTCSRCVPAESCMRAKESAYRHTFE